jgi:cysteine desulfurase
LGKAVEILTPELNHESERILKLRDDMEREILHLYPHFSINGKGAPRVPHVSNVRCVGIDGETLLINLDVNGVAVSSGAACSSGSQEPSPVLRAMGLTHSEASESLRISLGWLTTEEEIKRFLRVFRMAVERMKCVGYSETLEGERDKLL